MANVKRKVIKAGVELRVKSKTGTFEHVGYFASKLEAQVHSQKFHRGSDFRVQAVRVDATPLVIETRDKGVNQNG